MSTRLPLRFGAAFLSSLLLATLMIPSLAVAAEIQTDLWVYQDGDTVTVTGVEFGASEVVDFVTTDPEGTVIDTGSATTDEVGGVVYQFVLHVTVGGIYNVVATGQSSGLTASTQFDPPNFGFTVNAPAPSTVNYSDKVTFSGTFTCTNGSGGSPNCPTTSHTQTATIAIRMGAGGFVNVAAVTLTFTWTSSSSGCPLGCSIPWSVVWQSGREASSANTVPGTYDVRVTPSGTANLGSQQTTTNALVISSEASTTTYTGGTGGSPASSLALGATVADADGGVPAASNGVFSPDANLPGTNVVSFQLRNAADTADVGSAVLASINSSGATTGSPTLTLPAAGTYKLRTTYLGNTFYVTSSDLDTITVASPNDAPNAVDDGPFTFLEDSGAHVISVLGNDSDPDLNPITITAVTQGSRGGVSFTTSNVTYTPNANECGADSFTYTISDGSLTDTATVSISLTCVNDAPSATPQTVNTTEDATNVAITLTGSVTPPANESAQTLTFVLDSLPANGDLSETSGGAFLVTAATLADAAIFYTPDPNYCGSDSFTFHVVDSGGTSDGGVNTSTTVTVSINVSCVNDAPVVAFVGGASDVSEGPGSYTYTYTFAVTDPDGGDHFAVVAGYPACGASGTLVMGSLSVTPDGGTFDCRFLDDNPTATSSDTSIVSIQVTDDAAVVSNVGTRNTTVNNVEPVVDAGAGDTIDEGDTFLGSGSFTDPGDDEWTATVDYGDGTGTNPLPLSGMTFNLSHLYADDNATDAYTVTVCVDDDDLGRDCDTLTVTVHNVNPTVTLSGPTTASEGSAVSYTLSITDPGTDTFTLDSAVCGTLGSLSNDSFDGVSGGFDCTWSDDSAGSIVKIDVSDDDGGTDSDTKTVVVSNVDPTVSLSGDADVDEGGSVTYSFTLTDPGDDTFVVDSIDCGFGAQVGSETFETDTGAGSFVCAFADDNPTATSSDVAHVSITISDDDGGSDDDTVDTTVHNVAPVVEAGSGDTINEGGTFSGAGSFTDPGTDTWSATVDYGDGSGTSSLALNPDKTFSLSHVYADDDVDDQYTVTICVDDDDLGYHCDTLVVTVLNVNPTVTLTGAATANEGDSVTYSFTTSDPGTETFALSSISCHFGAQVDAPTFNSVTGAGSFACAFADDTPTGTPSDTANVSVVITDGDGGSGTGNASTLVSNLAPTMSGVLFSYNPVTHVAAASANYADAGVLDAHTYSFNWVVTGGPGSVTHTGTAVGGTVADAITLGTASCYTISVTIRVTDDDTGFVEQSPASAFVADAYAVNFRAPIKDNERNITKYGSVLPVKVELVKFCGAGGTDTTRSLYVSYVVGVVDETIVGTEDVATSVSNADTGNLMRVADGGYIYNWSTKPLAAGQDYTLRIRLDSPTGPVIQQAVIRPKK